MSVITSNLKEIKYTILSHYILPIVIEKLSSFYELLLHAKLSNAHLIRRALVQLTN